MIRYLIVDDEPIAHRIIETYCENLPHLKKKGNCYNAFEAMQFLNENTIDLVFLDINMPKMSGFDFLKTTSNPPKIIVTTAYKEYAVEKEEEMGEIIFLALGQLKGLALKAAQILGQEAQMIPEPIRKKLQQSFNQVPALNRSLVRKMMKNSLGQGINEVFAKFDEKASGAASLGQVHKGVLRSGEEVAVKIQYPGVATAMAGDLKLIKRLVKGFADSDFFEQSYQEVG